MIGSPKSNIYDYASRSEGVFKLLSQTHQTCCDRFLVRFSLSILCLQCVSLQEVLLKHRCKRRNKQHSFVQKSRPRPHIDPFGCWFFCLSYFCPFPFLFFSSLMSFFLSSSSVLLPSSNFPLPYPFLSSLFSFPLFFLGSSFPSPLLAQIRSSIVWISTKLCSDRPPFKARWKRRESTSAHVVCLCPRGTAARLCDQNVWHRGSDLSAPREDEMQDTAGSIRRHTTSVLVNLQITLNRDVSTTVCMLARSCKANHVPMVSNGPV